VITTDSRDSGTTTIELSADRDTERTRMPLELVSGRRLFAELLASALPGFAVEVIQPLHLDTGGPVQERLRGPVVTRAHAPLGTGQLFNEGSGVVVIDVSPSLDVDRTSTVLSQARAAGRQVLVLVDDGDVEASARWIELGAAAVLTATSSPADVADTLERLARGEVVLGVAVREGLLARLRARRKAEQQRVAAFEQLTRRESAVLRQLAEGMSPEEIAQDSYVSLNTVRTQVRGILMKLGVRSVVAAVVMSYRTGWIAGENG
jgi:DNA-binding NarL/FixJ family response regulator